MKRVDAAGLPRVRALLESRAYLAMFPLANLDRYGLDGDHARAPRLWEDGGDVLCVTREGMVMPMIAPRNAGAAARVIAGREVIGVIGQAAGARALMDEAGLAGLPAAIDRDEPHFLLDLDDLRVPEGPGELRALTGAPRALIEDWRVAYDVEALGSDEAEARARIPSVVDDYIAQDSHRVLMVEGEPVCTTGFNASQAGIVQIGGVYTPPSLRRRGHAARAVGLHLAEAKARGVRAATLFAASEEAGRVYEKVGFRRIGDWTFCLFKSPQVARG